MSIEMSIKMVEENETKNRKLGLYELAFDLMLNLECGVCEDFEEKKLRKTISYLLTGGISGEELVSEFGFFEKDVKSVEWDMYLIYLKEWVETHKESEFYGMTPPCFEEFLDNDLEECDCLE